MKILFLTTHLNTGGITSYLYTLSKGFIAAGHEVYIVSSSGNRQEEFRKCGVKVYVVNIKTKSELSPKIYLNLSVVRDIIKLNNIDVIHSHTRVTQVMGRILEKQTNVPMVATCHGFFKDKLIRRLFPCWGHRTIAISDPVFDHLKNDLGVSAENIRLVSNGIDCKDFAPISEEEKKSIRGKFNLGDQLLVGIIARLSDVKGHDILIKAMPDVLKEIANIKLLIVGQGKEEEKLKSLVQNMNLENVIEFIPVVGQSQELLPVLDVFVMPSRNEGLGISIMEAQASGVPVIGSFVGGIPDLIKHKDTGLLVSPENPNELARAIISMLKNKEKAQKMGMHARKFIAEKFSLEQMVNETIDVYKQVIT